MTDQTQKCQHCDGTGREYYMEATTSYGMTCRVCRGTGFGLKLSPLCALPEPSEKTQPQQQESLRMNQTPAWINRAAEAIMVRYEGDPRLTSDAVRDSISARAPQPKPFEWEHWIGDTWYAKTPFGDYCAHGRRWSFNGYVNPADSLESAKAAAFADYCNKLAACYGEAEETTGGTDQ